MVNKKKARKQKRQQQAAATTATADSAGAAVPPSGDWSRPSTAASGTSTADLRRKMMQHPFTATTKEELDAIKSPHVVSSDKNDPVPAPPGSTCWICLEGPDDADAGEGPEPLRRNCACRGSSSGYAHLSCLSSYATARSEEIWTGRRKAEENTNQLAFGMPWESCPNCKEFFTGKLQVDLAYEYARSTEGMVGGLRAFRHITARSWVTKALQTYFFANYVPDDVSAAEVELEFDKLLELIQSVRELGVYDPPNPVMEYMRLHLLQMESETNANFAIFVNQNAKMVYKGKMDTEMTKAYEKSCTLYSKSIRQAEDLKGMSIYDGGGTEGEAESALMQTKSGLATLKKFWRNIREQEAGSIDAVSNDTHDHNVIDDEERVIELSEKALKLKIKERGTGSSEIVALAVAHAENLLGATNPRRPFEALDLLVKTLSDARRTLGPDHEQTRAIVVRIGLFKKHERGAYFKDPQRQYHKVDHYDDDLNLYVMDVKEILNNGPEIAWSPSELILKSFALVQCVDLKGAVHLNGKRGYVSGFDDSKGRHMVEFEDRSLKPCLVKPGNLRLLLVDQYINGGTK